ncbi:MAG: sulfite exporter TauE/SafE family protein [bacterium]|nr:sulfite exporter TauE/SafE family protein [bacterium]
MGDCCGAVPEVGAALLTLWAAFGIGLTTSLGHCIGMCGPIITTFSLAQGRTDRQLSSLLPALIVYHLGRVNSYAIIGLVLGLIASAAQATGPTPLVRGWLFLIAGLFMLMMGLGLLGWLPTARFLESNALGRMIAEKFLGLLGTSSLMGRYLLGLANGFLPCGPVYAVAAVALTAPTPLHGAGTMGMFGLGTIPVLLFIGLGVGRLTPTLQRRFNILAAILVLIVGLEFLFRAGKIFGFIKTILWGFLPVW